MNKNFYESFCNLRENPPIVSGIMQTNVYRNKKDLDYICYVEGSTDEDFYGNIVGTNISNKCIKFVRMLTTRENSNKDDIGKEGVIKNYKGISEFNQFKYILPKCIFIVDHDFEGLISQFYDKREIEEKYFSITIPYSFENYFFTNENIRKIFNYFKLSKNEYENFIIKLDKFVNEISEYTRLKSCVTIACKKGKYQTYLNSSKAIIPYGYYLGEEISPEHIFNFDFLGKYKYYFRKDLLEMKNVAMNNAIKDNIKIKEYYNNNALKFVNKREFVRGHDLYSFLERYLLQKYNINISPKKYNKTSRYLEIVKIINVDMDFVNGIGEVIK